MTGVQTCALPIYKLNANAGGVPFLIIGDKYFIGYSEGVTSIEIEEQIKYALRNQLPDVVGEIIGKKMEVKNNINNSTEEPGEKINTEKEKFLKLPFLGNVNVYKVSIPVLAITMGVLDGFNPCAMWVLLFLISMLIGMADRKRMWAIGTTFIVASAVVYFIFMAAWLNLIIFLGFVTIIRIIIGLLALIGGGYNLKEFFTNKDKIGRASCRGRV